MDIANYDADQDWKNNDNISTWNGSKGIVFWRDFDWLQIKIYNNEKQVVGSSNYSSAAEAIADGWQK